MKKMKKMKKMMKNMVCMLLCAVMALSVITIPEKVTAETTTLIFSPLCEYHFQKAMS